MTYPPGGRLGPRVQPYMQFVLVHSGSITVWIDGERRHAPAMTAAVLLPGHTERFAFAADRDTWHSYAHVGWAKGAPTAILKWLRLLPWPLPLTAAMRSLMFHALDLRHATLPTRDQVLGALAVQLIWQYIGEGELLLSGDEDQTLHPVVAAACEYIRVHLADALDLERITDAVAVSPSHLIRLFQAALGTTPIAYLWEQRVQYGIELLEQTGLPVGHIADRCGFQSRHHFARRIRDATGLAPTAVRHRAWQRAE